MTDETLETEALDPEASTAEQPDELDNQESALDETGDGDDAAAKPKKSGVQKRIDELVKDREDWKRQAQYFATLAKDKETQPQAPQAETKADEPAAPPKADDFDTYEEYIDALTDYKTDAALARQAEKGREKANNERQTQARQAQQQAVQAKILEGREKYDDFDSVALSGAVPITQAVAEAIGDSDVGADLAYFLGSNPAEAIKIAEMQPAAALRALGRIEAQLEATPIQTAEKSKAPAPIAPVSKSSKVSADPENMSVDEWMKWRRSQVG